MVDGLCKLERVIRIEVLLLSLAAFALDCGRGCHQQAQVQYSGRATPDLHEAM